jgi:hypothetical protein
VTEPDEAGIAAARRYAGWELGDSYWANRIIRAYLDPDAANARMDAESIPKVTGAYR